MNTKSVRLPLVFVTVLTALYAACHSATVIAQATRPEAATVPDGARAPALEPSFTVQDVPELAAVRPSTQGTPAPPPAENDIDHVARLMAGCLRCGDTYGNDVGGRNSECLAVAAK